MFTGIIETTGFIKEIKKNNDNLEVTISTSITHELKVDQSVAHNGVCLTVTSLDGSDFTVTAIRETVKKTNLGEWKTGDNINIERAMKLGDRLDGHIVQGHVDQIGICTSITEANGSWYYSFEYDASLKNLTIEKGSVTINGVSLTVVNSKANGFSVAIIPYTYENTNFNSFKIGTKVNLEFDVIGKYISRLYALRQ